MPALSKPLNLQQAVERVQDIDDGDRLWVLVGAMANGMYRVFTLLPDDWCDETQHDIALSTAEAVKQNEWGDFQRPGLAECTAWTVVHAPSFDCEAHDDFKWDKVQAELDAQDLQDDDQDDDQCVRQLYLGSLIHIMPSHQIRAPWSSARACPLCGGHGHYSNVLYEAQQYSVYEKLRARITQRNVDKGLSFDQWPEIDRKEARVVDTHLLMCREHFQCAFCNGDGSRIRVEDSDYYEYMESKVGEFGAFLTGSDGDGCDLYVAKCYPKPEKEDDDEEVEEAAASDPA